MGERLASLAAGTVPESPPPEAIAAAAEAGFGAAGVWFDASSWTDATTKAVRERLDATGLVALDVEPVMLAPSGDHGDALVDVAAAVGARFVLVASRDPDHERVAARLAALAARLDGSGVRLVLEFLPALAVRTLEEAAAIVRSTGRSDIGVLVDALHLARSGATPAALAAHDPTLFPYLQLCDAPAASPGDDPATLIQEALHGRLLSGEGGLPERELVDAVPGVPLSFEVRSAALRERFPDPVDRARAVLAAARRAALLA